MFFVLVFDRVLDSLLLGTVVVEKLKEAGLLWGPTSEVFSVVGGIIHRGRQGSIRY